MAFNIEALLPPTTYGTPSGNYDGTHKQLFGNAIPAANYYGGQGSAQTAIITTTGFQGLITIEGTLNDWTQQAAWFKINTYGNADIATTDTQAIPMAGNFVWLRANVSAFTGGTINTANVVY